MYLRSRISRLDKYPRQPGISASVRSTFVSWSVDIASVDLDLGSHQC